MESIKGKVVLSLFDGCSGGQIALERAGIKVYKYYASEIDKYAREITQKNYPNTIQLGDVTKWKEWDIDWASIDIVIGGSPCQSFSTAGSGSGFNGTSGLFFDFADVYHEVLLKNPKALFLLENVVMKKEWKDIITNVLGVEPILIDSALVSAQRRNRLYWTNIPNVEQPKDKGIILKDILDDLPYRKIKPFAYGYFGKSQRIDRFNWICKEKSNTITTSKTHPTQYLLNENKSLFRTFTPIEYERLQTLPENYTEGINNTQRYKMIGNGWTIDVIAHIFKHIK